MSYNDESGKRVSKPSRQPTKVQARKYLEQIEARIAAGLVEPTEEPPVARAVADLRQ